ncbi:MAG: FHA domain-containing protein [Anaerolineae bacterium]
MQAGESFRLVVRRGPQPNQVYELRDDVINLGRDITNTIAINDREVSRHHLRFTRSGDTYMIEDLGSTNGTFINGKRLAGSTLLKNGDMIGLGETVTLGFEVVRPGSANPYQAPPPASAANPYQPPQAVPAAPPVAPVNPYQPPQAAPAAPPVAPVNPYQPPSVLPQPQNPYQAPPAPGYVPPSVDPYSPPPTYSQPDPYAQGYQDPQYAGYYGQPPAGYGAPPPPVGYDYDPYAMREQGASPWRPILIGCVGLMVFCCVLTIGVFVLVDTLNLYCQIPGVNSVLQALGMIRCN